jgi:hypothetical protein
VAGLWLVETLTSAVDNILQLLFKIRPFRDLAGEGGILFSFSGD